MEYAAFPSQLFLIYQDWLVYLDLTVISDAVVSSTLIITSLSRTWALVGNQVNIRALFLWHHILKRKTRPCKWCWSFLSLHWMAKAMDLSILEDLYCFTYCQIWLVELTSMVYEESTFYFSHKPVDLTPVTICKPPASCLPALTRDCWLCGVFLSGKKCNL